MTIEQALTIVKAHGYRVSKPKAPQAPRPALNAVGKPYSPSFDPNYRMKYRAGSTAHLFKPYGPQMKLYSWNWEPPVRKVQHILNSGR